MDIETLQKLENKAVERIISEIVKYGIGTQAGVDILSHVHDLVSDITYPPSELIESFPAHLEGGVDEDILEVVEREEVIPYWSRQH